jgi:hypothetical protein
VGFVGDDVDVSAIWESIVFERVEVTEVWTDGLGTLEAGCESVGGGGGPIFCNPRIEVD